jgi:hypothetical protein
VRTVQFIGTITLSVCLHRCSYALLTLVEVWKATRGVIRPAPPWTPSARRYCHSHKPASSWLKRSRLRTIVSPSCSPPAVNSSTYLTERQCAMCLISPSPKTALSVPLQASRSFPYFCRKIASNLVSAGRNYVGIAVYSSAFRLLVRVCRRCTTTVEVDGCSRNTCSSRRFCDSPHSTS